MLLRRGSRLDIPTERLTLRPPQVGDHNAWALLRRHDRDRLQEWEPTWSRDHLSRAAFRARVNWSRGAIDDGRALPLFLIRRQDDTLLGAISLDNIRRGPAQSATIGYWIAGAYSGQGYMTEALAAIVHYAFTTLDLSRVEAACLPENTRSRRLLERCGFKYEGVAQSYLQIDGRWRTHVLFANLRHDRRGRVGEPAARAN
ncbi:MAG: GNAT family protein [Pseudomonadota bacterium]